MSANSSFCNFGPNPGLLGSSLEANLSNSSRKIIPLSFPKSPSNPSVKFLPLYP